MTVKQFTDNIIGNNNIELLSLDIEGIDAEIILDLPLKDMKIKYFSFEYIHLRGKKNSVNVHLKDNNFDYIGSGVDYQGFDKLYINNSI